MKTSLIAVAALAVVGAAFAKLPAPDEAAKAKAAETAAKSAWQAKVDSYLLCKSQDKIAARFGAGKTGAKTNAKSASAAAVPVAVAPAAAAPASMPAATASGATPVATAQIAPCIDPGPFAYTPPEQKPLESSGAHSPSGTAASPPSTKTPAAEMKPAEKKKS
jgi:hypothetical protein